MKTTPLFTLVAATLLGVSLTLAPGVYAAEGTPAGTVAVHTHKAAMKCCSMSKAHRRMHRRHMRMHHMRMHHMKKHHMKTAAAVNLRMSDLSQANNL